MHLPTIPSIHHPTLLSELNTAIDNKTKPIGSLGMLEQLARQVGLIQKTTQPQLADPVILIFAGDHGIVAEKVSAYPQSVTWQMVENFLAGGAAINVFARQNGFRLHIVDAGVNHDFGTREGLIDRKIAPGTRNFAIEPAMTRDQCERAMEEGMRLVDSLNGNVIGFGEMGIGNTTAAAALMHVMTLLPVSDCVGAGTGLSSDGVAHKAQVIAQAVERHGGSDDPIAALTTFGGFEIAMMAGAMLAAAQRRMVLLIDGFIVSSALLVAARMQPAILDYCVFSHCSNERGHRKMLEALKAKPLLQLELRLGEGTGSALAYPIVQSAVRFMHEMATFESAAVSGKHRT